jgi:hypothetical protein
MAPASTPFRQTYWPIRGSRDWKSDIRHYYYKKCTLC